MAEQKLFGQVVDKPVTLDKSKQFVLEGVQKQLTPMLQKAEATYKRRGFGGATGIHAPTIQQALHKPALEIGAETTRKALTDLYFKEEQLDLAKAASSRAERSLGSQLTSAELGQDVMRGRARGGKVLCTELHSQGMLPLKYIKADYVYLKKHVSKETHDNYLRWATKVVPLMRKSKLLTHVLRPALLAWSKYMLSVVEHRRPYLPGLIVHNIGKGIGKIYKFVKQGKRAEVT